MTSTANSDPTDDAPDRTTAPHGPLADPVHEAGERTITGIWFVGEPDAEGWQRMAQLTVEYAQGGQWQGYLSHLKSPRVKTENGVITEEFTLALRRLPIGDPHRAAHFHQDALTREFENRLAELRRRYTADDTLVKWFFEGPSSNAND